MWISNAPIADWALVYAVTDPEAGHRGLTAFMVELDAAGVRRGTLDKMGALASPTGSLDFDDVPVSADHRIGAEGQGFAMCMWQLNQTRLSCAAGALGVARAARESAVAYANQRRQFGKQIGHFQMIQDSLAQVIVEEEAARLLVYRAAHLADCGQPNNLEVSMAKYAAAEAAAHAADAAFKILGALRVFHGVPGGALPEGREVLPDRGRLLEHPQADHRPGRVGLPQGEPAARAARMNGEVAPVFSFLYQPVFVLV